jgi:CRP-like cAMP-binding protein
MKPLKHIELSSELIKKIITCFPSKKFKFKSHLFYEGQIPISGYLILDGSIELSSKKKFKKILLPGNLIGICELLEKKPIAVSAEVSPNTEVCFIDRTTLLEMCKDEHQNEHSELAQFFKTVSGELA